MKINQRKQSKLKSPEQGKSGKIERCMKVCVAQKSKKSFVNEKLNRKTCPKCGFQNTSYCRSSGLSLSFLSLPGRASSHPCGRGELGWGARSGGCAEVMWHLALLAECPGQPPQPAKGHFWPRSCAGQLQPVCGLFARARWHVPPRGSHRRLPRKLHFHARH